jgi:hypothetical protein
LFEAIEREQEARLEGITFNLHPFYCSAALMQVVPIHNTIQSKSVAD